MDYYRQLEVSPTEKFRTPREAAADEFAAACSRAPANTHGRRSSADRDGAEVGMGRIRGEVINESKSGIVERNVTITRMTFAATVALSIRKSHNAPYSLRSSLLNRLSQLRFVRFDSIRFEHSRENEHV